MSQAPLAAAIVLIFSLLLMGLLSFFALVYPIFSLLLQRFLYPIQKQLRVFLYNETLYNELKVNEEYENML